MRRSAEGAVDERPGSLCIDRGFVGLYRGSMLPEPSLIDTFKTNPLFMLGALMFLGIGLVLSLVGAIVRAKQPKTARIAAFAAIVSGLSKVNFELDLVRRALDMPGICGVKDSSCDMIYFHRLLEIAKQRTLQRTQTMPMDALVIDENAFDTLQQYFEPIDPNVEECVAIDTSKT